jgi:hypothetical protein
MGNIQQKTKINNVLKNNRSIESALLEMNIKFDIF